MPILIAVNPYKKLNLYTDSIIKSYKDYFNKFKSNPTEAGAPIPHLYHLAEAEYTDMINDKKNQSLIISGESGSGKTESTKIILKYLAVSSIGSQKDKPKERLSKVKNSFYCPNVQNEKIRLPANRSGNEEYIKKLVNLALDRLGVLKETPSVADKEIEAEME